MDSKQQDNASATDPWTSSATPKPAPYGDPWRIANVARWLLVGCIIFAVLTMFIETIAVWLCTRTLNGEDTSEPFTILAYVEPVCASVHFVLFFASAITFLMWVNRIRKNLKHLNVQHLRFKHNIEAVGSFIIPVINLWRPIQMMQETWQATDPKNLDPVDWKRPKGSRLLDAWWFAWLFFNGASSISSALMRGINVENPDINKLLVYYQSALVSDVLEVLAGVLAIKVILTVTTRSVQKYEALALCKSIAEAAQGSSASSDTNQAEGSEATVNSEPS